MELWARNCPVILPKFRLPRKFRDVLHAANVRHGTDGFTSPQKEGVLRILFALKILTASAGFEPANFGTKGQHAAPRPPKQNQLDALISQIYFWNKTLHVPDSSSGHH